MKMDIYAPWSLLLMTRSIHPDPVSAAFHEAGHCLLAIVLGFQLLAVYIRGIGTKRGGVWVDKPNRAYTTRKDTTGFTKDDRRELLEDVAFLMAGKLAEEVVAKRTPDRTWSVEDEEDILQRTRWFFQGREEDRKNFLAEAERWTRRILGANAASIQRLALQLLRQSRVWGDEATMQIGRVSRP